MSQPAFPWFAAFCSPFFAERTPEGDDVFTSMFEKAFAELGFAGRCVFAQLPPIVDDEYLPQDEADRLAGLPRVLKGGAGKPRYPITLHLARFQSQQMIVELDAYPDVWRLSVQRTPAEVNAIEAHLRQRNVVDLELNKAATTEQMVSRIATRISDFRGFPPGWFA